jgi:hypothetical protein
MQCTPVGSLDEVRAAQIALDGSVHVFPDLTGARIYTKQINLNGLPEIKTYEIVQAQPENSLEVRVAALEAALRGGEAHGSDADVKPARSKQKSAAVTTADGGR